MYEKIEYFELRIPIEASFNFLKFWQILHVGGKYFASK